MDQGVYNVTGGRGNPTSEQIEHNTTGVLRFNIRKASGGTSLNVDVRVSHFKKNPDGSFALKGSIIIHQVDQGEVTVTYYPATKTGTFLFSK